MGRAPCCDKASVKRGPWSPEEDDILRNYIQRCGTGGNWISLPAKAGLKRCGKSCRLRWLNYLRPDIKHGGFTEEEDSIICTLYYHIGSRWSVIASKLPGRTDNDVKNYWNTKLKKKLLTQMTSLKTVVVPNNFEHQNQLQSSASIDSQLSNGGQFDQGASAPESRSPFQSLLDVSDYSCASSVPEVSTLSSVESSVVMGSDSSWPANGSSAEEETTLDFDFESVHDVISGFDFQQGIS